jgi:hypothetical protein
MQQGRVAARVGSVAGSVKRDRTGFVLSFEYLTKPVFYESQKKKK